ncbi:condensation domain-containing protein [Solicola gregarius]|uniref:Condensation domain-containing protein n=1 Tax=Solicola gregarius TaxID=2908642 RepID=A0AA46YJI8_9ACTN|nr:hypothetical protein [Solicola gregarius]UYM03629.1 hypothetical protein L0C25_13830 [Solicola gregarius]
MDPPQRVKAVNRLAEHGLLGTVQAPLERRDVVGSRLTHKQQALWTLDHGGRHGDFYHCGALWFAPCTPAVGLAAAFAAVAPDFDALGRGVGVGADGAPFATRVPVPTPTVIAVPTTATDPRRWVQEAVAVAAHEPIDIATEPARVLVYALPDESGAIGVVGHDLHLDEQGLWQVLGPAISAHLTGTEPVREQLRISDLADWQQRELDGGLLEFAVEAGRTAVRDTPRCPLNVRGARDGRRVHVGQGADAWAALRNRAAEHQVSSASVALSAWYRSLRTWYPALAEAPIGCCTTARMRPELRTTLGNLTNTVVVVPAADWPEMSDADLPVRVHRALTAALGTADLPFESVFADEPVQDEQIGVRFTFTENPPDEPDVLRPSPVQFGYAKSVLSGEVRVTGGVLEADVDHRAADLAPEAADNLAALLRENLGFTD